MEDPDTVEYQFYSETIWQEWVDEAEEMGRANRFDELGLTVKVLHDPQLDRNKKTEIEG